MKDYLDEKIESKVNIEYSFDDIVNRIDVDSKVKTKSKKFNFDLVIPSLITAIVLAITLPNIFNGNNPSKGSENIVSEPQWTPNTDVPGATNSSETTINSVTYVVTSSTKENIDGDFRYLLNDGALVEVFFDPKGYNIDLKEGMNIVVRYTGNMIVSESWPGIVSLESIEIREIEVINKE